MIRPDLQKNLYKTGIMIEAVEALNSGIEALRTISRT